MNLPERRFNREWIKVARIERCKTSDVRDFIATHYLRKRPAICVLSLRVVIHELPVGMVIFSIPPKETEKRYGGKTLELARLYLRDEIPFNAETWLIAQSVRFVKREFPDVRFIVSYADPSAGHTGTIYRASNWTEDGMTDQERKSPRCDYVDTNSGKKYGRKGNVPAGAAVIRLPRVSKFRFVWTF